MKKKKLLTAVMSLALVGAVAVGGTLAYLSDASGKVTNTFTMGAGYETVDDHTGLWLDETKKKDGTRYPTEIGATAADRIEGDEDGTNGVQYQELLPGDNMVKDPTFHMTEGSVKSRVVMKVTGLDKLNGNHFTISYNQISYNEDGSIYATALNVDTRGETWRKIANTDGSEDNLEATLDGYYVYNTPVDASAGAVDLEPLFRYITFDKNVDTVAFNEIKTALGNDTTIKVGGVATQWDNTTVDDTLEFAKDSLGTMQ